MRKTTRLVICAWLALAGACTLPAQQEPAKNKQQFDVATVKPAEAPTGGRTMALGMMRKVEKAGMIPMPDAGRVRIQTWPLRHVVAAAYRMRDDNVAGPKWMEDAYFDIEATMPAGAKMEDANEMLRTLLAERFGLQTHMEKREAAGFVLTVGKNGAKLEESTAASATESLSPEELAARQKQQQEQMMKNMQERMRTMRADGLASRSTQNWRDKTSAEFAASLAPLVGGPVVDQTGLKGRYNIKLETWREKDDGGEQTIFMAVEKLGLKLTPQKMPVDVLVVDQVSKTPTEN